MERRRFVPSSESLEGRTLQATVNPFNPFGAQVTSNLNIPISYQQKALRIDACRTIWRRSARAGSSPSPKSRKSRMPCST